MSEGCGPPGLKGVVRFSQLRYKRSPTVVSNLEAVLNALAPWLPILVLMVLMVGVGVVPLVVVLAVLPLLPPIPMGSSSLRMHRYSPSTDMMSMDMTCRIHQMAVTGNPPYLVTNMKFQK